MQNQNELLEKRTASSPGNSYPDRGKAIVHAGVLGMLNQYAKLDVQAQLEFEERYKTDPQVGIILGAIKKQREQLSREGITPREALVIMQRVKQGMDYWVKYCLYGEKNDDPKTA